MEKTALNNFPLQQLLKRRWSPTVFSDHSISAEDLGSLFEAARWSASCFNEQPWNFVIASRHGEPGAFQALLSCLVSSNAAWAQHAPHLMFSVAKLHYDKGGKLNPYAWYDSGQAMAHLSIQAVELGIFVHQMAGFDAKRAKAVMQVPDTHEVICAIALGYGLNESEVPLESKTREESSRTRKPTGLFVYQGSF